MGRHKEPLSNGVMTGPDPAMLPEGTLSYIRNGVYKPNTLALQRASGRSTWWTTTASAADVVGIRDIQFDNGDHYIVAQVSCTGKAFIATASAENAAASGVLTTAISATTAFEAVHFSNRHYLFNGYPSANLQGLNSNFCVYLSSTGAGCPVTLRQHGMAPVTSLNGTSTAASSFAASASGFYEYWYTEVYQYKQDGNDQEIESAFGASGMSPETWYVSSTAVAPIIKFVGPRNPVATHWRIYRSVPKTYATDKAFPAGFLVATQSTATAQYVDTSTPTVGSQVLPGSVQTNLGFSNPNNILAADNTYTVMTAVTAGWFGFPNFSHLDVVGFNFGGFKGPILGVGVEIKASASNSSNAAAPVMVTIGKKNPDTNDFDASKLATRGFTVTSSAAAGTYTVGGSADRWIPNGQVGFFDTDFDSNFMVRLQVYETPAASANNVPAFDYVKVTPYYGAGQSESAVTPFPTVVYTFGDLPVQDAKNGPPPIANTGDIFNDSLVTNSILEPKLIRYSYPNAPESFPSTYYLGFDTKDNDVVTLVKRVNNCLVVGLKNSVWRVNYLPSERDASFDRGVAIQPISKQYGVVNPMCAATFSIDGGIEMLAFVSQKGLHTTDGERFATQTQNQDWRQVLDISGNTSTPIALINDPENQELLLYYRNDALTPETYMCLHFNYSLTHIGTLHSDTGPSRTFEAALKVAGPVHMRNYESGGGTYAGIKSAWAVPRANTDTTIFLGYGVGSQAAGAGQIYYENGTTIPANDPVMRFRTRRMYIAGESNEFRMNEAYAYIGSYTNSIGIDMATQNVKTNDDSGEVTRAAKTTLFAGRKLGKWQFREMCEGLILSAAVTGNPNNDLAVEYLMLDGEGFGVEDSGK
jgi:hypothetical protein